MDIKGPTALYYIQKNCYAYVLSVAAYLYLSSVRENTLLDRYCTGPMRPSFTCRFLKWDLSFSRSRCKFFV